MRCAKNSKRQRPVRLARARRLEVQKSVMSSMAAKKHPESNPTDDLNLWAAAPRGRAPAVERGALLGGERGVVAARDAGGAPAEVGHARAAQVDELPRHAGQRLRLRAARVSV